jgi:hypothetical protein
MSVFVSRATRKRLKSLKHGLTLNQRVQGSSPYAPTIDFKEEFVVSALVAAPCLVRLWCALLVGVARIPKTAIFSRPA